MRRYGGLIIPAILLSGCSHFSDNTRSFLTNVGGGLAGYAVGTAIDGANKSGEKNSAATKATWTAIGVLSSAALDAYVLRPKTEAQLSQIDKAKTETNKLMEMDRNQGRYPLKDALVNGPERIKCEGNGSDIVSLCTDKDGDLGECELDKLGFKYLSSNIAVQFVSYYSPSGCFQPPYNNPPELDKYFGKVYLELKTKIKKDK